MKTMHTPGPWHFFEQRDGGFQIGTDANFDRADILCSRFSWEDRAQEMHANGRLMSAAPEMLRILVDTYYRLADIHNEWPGRDSLAGQKRLCDMRDCIAKALGMESKDVYEGEAMRMGAAP